MVTKIDIKSDPLNFRIENKLAKIAIRINHYSPLTENNEKQIKKFLNKIQTDTNNKYYSLITAPLTFELFTSIRSAYLKEKLINNFYVLKEEGSKEEIMKLYEKEKLSFIDIAKKYHLSPLTIFRFIMKSIYGDNYKEIKKDFKKNLSEVDYVNMKEAEKCDIVAPFDHDKTLELSLEFEDKIEEVLKKYNIDYKTQKDLEIEQTKKYGRPINTPDFLILDELYINEKRINWIDAKNYFGSNTRLIKKNIKKQTAKYLKEYGSGAIIFSKGFSSKLKDSDYLSSDIMLLDYQQINL